MEVGSEGHFPRSKLRGQITDQIIQKIMYFFKNIVLKCFILFERINPDHGLEAATDLMDSVKNIGPIMLPHPIIPFKNLDSS